MPGKGHKGQRNKKKKTNNVSNSALPNNFKLKSNVKIDVSRLDEEKLGPQNHFALVAIASGLSIVNLCDKQLFSWNN